MSPRLAWYYEAPTCPHLERGRVWMLWTFGGACRDGLAAFWAWVRNDLGGS